MISRACDVVLCGVGGQGTVLASRLLSSCAQERHVPVKAAETIGMSQRGGSVVSHVRMGEGVASPLVGRGRADLLVGFEPAEAARQLVYLAPGGTAVVASRAIVPASTYAGGPSYDPTAILAYVERRAARLVMVDANAAAEELGSAKCLNVVLLGAAARAGSIPFSVGDVRGAVERLVPERFLSLNLRALEYGSSQI